VLRNINAVCTRTSIIIAGRLLPVAGQYMQSGKMHRAIRPLYRIFTIVPFCITCLGSEITQRASSCNLGLQQDFTVIKKIARLRESARCSPQYCQRPFRHVLTLQPVQRQKFPSSANPSSANKSRPAPKFPVQRQSFPSSATKFYC
jgi:hypothetical protein